MHYALRCSLFGYKPTLLIHESCRLYGFIWTLDCFMKGGRRGLCFCHFWSCRILQSLMKNATYQKKLWPEIARFHWTLRQAGQFVVLQ